MSSGNLSNKYNDKRTKLSEEKSRFNYFSEISSIEELLCNKFLYYNVIYPVVHGCIIK